jgi:hypothetical protein
MSVGNQQFNVTIPYSVQLQIKNQLTNQSILHLTALIFIALRKIID